MRRLSGWLSGTAALLALLLVGCAQQDVAELRRNYSAELQAFVVKKEPTDTMAEAEMAEGETEAEAGAEEGETGEEEGTGTEAMGGPVTADIVLDIAVSHEGAGRLPGVTLDVTQADASEDVKRTWKVYVDTSTMGVEKQISHTLKDVEYEEGDGFHVEVRQSIPPEEQGEYKEFQQHS